MASSKTPNYSELRSGKAEDAPAWAAGLKQLYDTIVDEPLPDAFNDLLAQLDQSDQSREGGAETPRSGGES